MGTKVEVHNIQNKPKQRYIRLIKKNNKKNNKKTHHTKQERKRPKEAK